ncbi:MCE family protein [Sporichthya sp.]|uniref:MCE family protein n=1 Tax=Sporichthya sp. TaxID=65475 RepID=UPI0017A9CC0A|nr:MCE family protein [Sporichthya sp.]MBA3744411.1 MCE family protein [Sporichthya sp.]
MLSRLLRVLAASSVTAVLLAGGGCGVLGGDSITITAHFTDSVGLFPGNHVDVLGVPVGTVTDVEPQGTSVAVSMSIPADFKVPADAGALIIPPTVITDRYVELTPVWSSGPVMADGAVIPLERTRTPVEFDRIIKALDGLANSLSSDARTVGAIQDALGVAAKNLKGNGTAINKGIAGLSTVIGTLSADRDDLTTLIRSLDGLTATFAQNDATVRRFGRNVTQATKVLADNGALLASTLEALTGALTEVRTFVTTNSGAVRTSLRDLTAVLAVLNDHRAELTEAIDVLPLTLQNLSRAVDPRSDRLVFNASAAANLLNPVAAQQICDALGTLCPNRGKPIGALSEVFGPDGVRR